MDFMQRGQKPQNTQNESNDGDAPKSTSSFGGFSSSKKTASGGMKIASIALLFSVTLLAVALIAYLAFGKSTTKTASESTYVNTKSYQAVFLNGGQVYFGKVTTLNSEYIRLADIYYLRVNQQVQPGSSSTTQQTSGQDVSLAKLGCELHGPDDSMIINRSQVVFWENLKTKDPDGGAVIKAIDEYQKSDDSKKKCSEKSQQTSQTQQQTQTQQTTTTTPTNNTTTPTKKP
jgi:hypothetical protein